MKERTYYIRIRFLVAFDWEELIRREKYNIGEEKVIKENKKLSNFRGNLQAIQTWEVNQTL